MRPGLRTVTVGLLFTVAVTRIAVAQSPSSKWQWIIQPYFMAPHMNGTTGIGPVSADVDVGPGEIFSRLQFGLMFNVEGRTDRWAIGLDATYMDLEEDSEGGNLTVGTKQSAVELDVFRRLGKAVELFAGARYNSLSSSIQGNLIDQSLDQSWIDPVVGLRFGTAETGKWSFSMRGDIGGFGLGSALTVQILPIVGFRLSRTIGLALGYRYLDADYENEDDAFIYDMKTFGPDLRVRIYF
jgi:hypothetical protein